MLRRPVAAHLDKRRLAGMDLGRQRLTIVSGGHGPGFWESVRPDAYHDCVVKLVLFADLHLDAPFAWLGASQLAARRRRQALRDTLRNIVTLTRETKADALVCAGDLYEQAR